MVDDDHDGGRQQRRQGDGVSAKRLVVESVQIHNLNGFTGNYNLGLDGNASVAMTDATYHITGNVLGYEPPSIAPTARPFDIKVAC